MVRAAAAALAAVLVAAGAAEGAEPPARLSVPSAEAEVIVRFTDAAGPARRAAVRRAAGTPVDRPLLLEDAQLLRVEQGTAAQAARELERMSGVAWAEPNHPVHGGAAPTDDPRFDELWGLKDLNALPAWDVSRGAGAVIAVIDTGVAMDHPDIAPNLWVNAGERAGNGIDDDGNGFVDDRNGWDFWQGDSDPDDFHLHGTHVAGTAAAAAGNGIGIAGVAHQARIMPVRALNDDNAGTTADIADAIVYAARNGADVINMSLGSSAPPSEVERDALDVARANDAVVVAAAMNDGQDNDGGGPPIWPCNFRHSNLVCVAAVDPGGALSAFSNWGATSVDVGAPGNSILSSVPDWEPVSPPGIDGFELDLAGRWGGAGPWARTSVFSTSPGYSLTDSPGGDYANDAGPYLAMLRGADLTGRRGCRINYELRGRVLEGDRWVAGAFDSAGNRHVASASSVDTHGEFEFRSEAISVFDGDPWVRAAFALSTDGSGVADGVYVDDLRFACRASRYDADSYLSTFGTSMAAPHVAGVAALVRSAVPAASAAEVVEAIRAGARPTPSLAGRTVSGGRVDAAAAIAAATPPAPAHRPAGSAPPEGAPAPRPERDRTAPRTRVLRVLVRRSLAVVQLSFPGESSPVSGTARLQGFGSKRYRSLSGRPVTVRIRARWGSRREAARRASARALLTVRARDAAGNESVTSASIRLRTRRAPPR